LFLLAHGRKTQSRRMLDTDAIGQGAAATLRPTVPRIHSRNPAANGCQGGFADPGV